MNKEIITVTSPLLPDLEEFHDLLKEIWASKWITNNGSFHQQLEKELAAYLKVPYLSLFTNGTLPLITALQALHVKGGYNHAVFIRCHYPLNLVERTEARICGYRSQDLQPGSGEDRICNNQKYDCHHACTLLWKAM